MYKCGSESLAKSIALREGLAYGWSVLGGAWYAGTPSQLEAIGVPEVVTP